jgi:hypothetical protein
MESLLPRPSEMDFDSSNLGATWKRWKQTIMLYMNALMKSKTEEEKYSTFLFLIGDRGRDIFNTWSWDKKTDADDEEIDEDDITIDELIRRFEEYCIPRKNLVLERRQFFQRQQTTDETVDAYITQLRNLSASCEFEQIKDGLILYKIVDGIKSEKVRDNLIRKGSDLTLDKSINICRSDEVTKSQMKLMGKEKEIAGISNRRRGGSNGNRPSNGLGGSNGNRPSSGLGGSSGQQPSREEPFGKQLRQGGSYRGRKSNMGKNCHKCGRIHEPMNCPAYGQLCTKWNKKNHWARCCNIMRIQETSTNNYLIEAVKSKYTKEEESNSSEATVIIQIHNENVKVKIDR